MPQRSKTAGPNGHSPEEIGGAFFPNFAIVREVLETARIGVWCWDVAANKLTWSSNLEAIHQLPEGSFDGTYACFASGIHRDDRAQIEASLAQAVQKRAIYHGRYRLLAREGREDCWIEASGTVTVANGTPERMLGLSYDVTERVKLESELHSRVKQQEALAQLGERALAEPDLDRLLNDAVSTVALTLTVDIVKILELVPGNDLVLRAAIGLKPNLVGTVITSNATGSYARYTLDLPLPVVSPDFTTETRFQLAPYLLDHGCISGVNLTIAGRDGRSFGILGVCTKAKRAWGAQDTAFLAAVANLLAGAIHRRLLEQRNELMIRDMRHRSGNLFSQLLALFSQTARTSKNIPELTSKYQARVLALANAHRLITEGGWDSLPIMELFSELLGPYLDRVALKGPNVELEPDPVFHLSAALHELADNAMKHGSLSRTKGSIDLTWSVVRTDRGITLVLDWVEKNGPATRRPKRSGFGTKLIDIVIERQLNGEVTRSFTRKGFSVHMMVPLTHERWPTGTAAETESETTAGKRAS